MKWYTFASAFSVHFSIVDNTREPSETRHGPFQRQNAAPDAQETAVMEEGGVGLLSARR